MSRSPSRAIRQGKARPGLGRDESNAHASLAVNGSGRGTERLRFLPSCRPENRRGSQGFDAKGSGFGVGSCDCCHTRHIFSVDEARSPQACRTCHIGVDTHSGRCIRHPSTGCGFCSNRAEYFRKMPPLPPARAVISRTEPMITGLPGDTLLCDCHILKTLKWARNRATIMQALGIFDPPESRPPGWLLLRPTTFMRFTEEDWKG